MPSGREVTMWTLIRKNPVFSRKMALLLNAIAISEKAILIA